MAGSGEPGLKDGDLGTAQFDHPQGMALDGDVLYVADTENHAIRRVDMSGGTVETVAGTGRQARGHSRVGDALSSDLSSPWDLALHDSALYIAMAGIHQLWKLDLKGSQVRPYAGNGREAPVDGPLLSASLDQPSGITTDGEVLYFADSEASAIRTADLTEDGRVTSIVGLDLFVFGDVDGSGDEVRLQHPPGHPLPRRRRVHSRLLQQQDKAALSPYQDRRHIPGHRRGWPPRRGGGRRSSTSPVA